MTEDRIKEIEARARARSGGASHYEWNGEHKQIPPAQDDIQALIDALRLTQGKQFSATGEYVPPSPAKTSYVGKGGGGGWQLGCCWPGSRSSRNGGVWIGGGGGSDDR